MNKIKGLLSFLVIAMLATLIGCGSDDGMTSFSEGVQPDSLFTIYSSNNVVIKTVNGEDVSTMMGRTEIKLDGGSTDPYTIEVFYDGSVTSTMTLDSLYFFPGEEFTITGTRDKAHDEVIFDLLEGNPEKAQIELDSLNAVDGL